MQLKFFIIDLLSILQYNRYSMESARIGAEGVSGGENGVGEVGGAASVIGAVVGPFVICGGANDLGGVAAAHRSLVEPIRNVSKVIVIMCCVNVHKCCTKMYKYRWQIDLVWYNVKINRVNHIRIITFRVSDCYVITCLFFSNDTNMG